MSDASTVTEPKAEKTTLSVIGVGAVAKQPRVVNIGERVLLSFGLIFDNPLKFLKGTKENCYVQHEIVCPSGHAVIEQVKQLKAGDLFDMRGEYARQADWHDDDGNNRSGGYVVRREIGASARERVQNVISID